MINQTELKQLLSYNHETGDFNWRISRSGIKKANPAGFHKTKEEAYLAYCVASDKYHGDFANTGAQS